MEKLYAPLLQHIFKRPVKCVQYCKWVMPDTPKPFAKSLEEFLQMPWSFATIQQLL